MTEKLQNPIGPWLSVDDKENMEGRVVRVGAERVTDISQTIRKIQKVRKYLQLNSVEIKTNIHSTMSRLLESLRTREVWLLDQVDVVYQAKELVLRQQEDRLNQVLGSLTNCIDLVETGAASEDELVAYLDSISSLDHHAEETPHITFRADMIALRESIQKFGRVDSRGLALPGAPLGGEPDAQRGGQASSLPRQFEDYGDDEHQVLYKTVNSVQHGMDADAYIAIKIPKLSDVGCGTFTFGGDESARPVLKESASAGVLKNLLGGQESALSRTSSLRQWLSDITTGECGLDDDEGMIGMSDTRIADLGYAVRSESSGVSSANNLAFSGNNSPPPEIKISTSEFDKQVLGVANSEGEEGRREVFESFRRICQRPLSDWLSRAYAMIDSKLDRSQAATELRYTLAAFHKVINSPFSDWLQATPPTTSSGQSGVDSPLWGRVDKLIDSHVAGEERSRNKWLLQNDCETTQKENGGQFGFGPANCSPRSQWVINRGDQMKDDCVSPRIENAENIHVTGSGRSNRRVLFDEKLDPFYAVFRRDTKNFEKIVNSGEICNDAAERSNLCSSFNEYVNRLRLESVSHWLARVGGLAYENVNQSGDASNNLPYNPLSAYLERSKGKPLSDWLSYPKKEALSFDGQLRDIAKTSAMECDGFHDSASTSSPYTQMNLQYGGSSADTSTNIGSAIAARPISDFLQPTTNENSNKESTSYERFLAGAGHMISGKPGLFRSGSLSALKSQLPSESDTQSPMKLVECMVRQSLRELSGSSMEDFDCVSDLSEAGFIEIGQRNFDESASASMALPLAFSQPIENWMSQQGEERCQPIPVKISDVGKGVVDRFALMEVSDWLVR